MNYLGIGYSGEHGSFLRDMVARNDSWLKGDRNPRFFGDRFIVLYDSNIAREFAQLCKMNAEKDAIVLYTMNRPHE
jgi:hypothetical protein